MRTAAAFVFAGLALPALAAEQLPDFRPGLWEFKRSVDSGDGKPATLTNQKCTSPTDDSAIGAVEIISRNRFISVFISSS